MMRGRLRFTDIINLNSVSYICFRFTCHQIMISRLFVLSTLTSEHTIALRFEFGVYFSGEISEIKPQPKFPYSQRLINLVHACGRDLNITGDIGTF